MVVKDKHPFAFMLYLGCELTLTLALLHTMLVIKAFRVILLLQCKGKECNMSFFLYRLQEVSDVAMMQASALQARQQSKEKEVEALRRQILDYQVTGVVFF